MAELNNTIVKGKLNVTDDIEASSIKVTTIKGATMTAPLSWKDGSALPSKSLSYVLGIDAFASGGQTGWQSKSDFLSGYEQLPAHASGKENYVLSVDSSGNLVWKAPYDGTASGS